MKNSLDLAGALRRPAAAEPVNLGTIDVDRNGRTTVVVHVAADGTETPVFVDLDPKRATIAAGLAQAVFLNEPVPRTAVDCVARWVDQGRTSVRSGVELFAACWTAGFLLWGQPCER